MKSINQGVDLFFLSVFPSLLPFLFLSKLLDSLGAFKKLNKAITPITRIFNVPTITCYPFLMTIISGYPIGAKIIGEMHTDNLISDKDAKRMIVMCSTSGPIFVIGSVGAGMLKNTKLGILIFVSHLLGSLLTAYLFCLKRSKQKDRTPSSININQQKNILFNATNSTIMSILTVAVYVSIFYMFIDMAYDLNLFKIGTTLFSKLLPILNIDPAYSFGLSAGLIEMTRGCKEIILLNNDFCSLLFCSSIISFGGLSIILQSLTFLHSTKIKPLFFIFFKTIQMFITLSVSILIGLVFL